jgi:ribonuclease Z
MLAWNIDEEGIRVRKVIATDEPLPASPPEPAGPPDRSERTARSKWLDAGIVDFSQ